MSRNPSLVDDIVIFDILPFKSVLSPYLEPLVSYVEEIIFPNPVLSYPDLCLLQGARGSDQKLLSHVLVLALF